MMHKSLTAVPANPVSMQGADNVQMQMLCGPDDGCPNFAMRKFIVGPGGYTPKHQHDFEHEILILAGEGIAFGNGKEQPVKTGDVLFVPANELHQFKNAGPTPFEFLCMVPAFVHKPGAPMPVLADCSADSVSTTK